MSGKIFVTSFFAVEVFPDKVSVLINYYVSISSMKSDVKAICLKLSVKIPQPRI